MKRTLIVLSLIAIALTFATTSRFATQPQNHHQAKSPTVDGSKNPAAIPDIAAYEIVLNLLSSTTPESKKEERKSAYLRAAGFNAAEAAAVTNAAYEYKRQIEPLDEQVDRIKHASWPNPSSRVMDELGVLQRQKEALIDTAVRSLRVQLANYEPGKLKRHIANVKLKTKAFSSALPSKRVSNSFLSSWFSASAQGAGCDASVYIYSDTTTDMGSLMVYGSGSYLMPYNNCNHTITLNRTLSGSGLTVYGGEGAHLNLYQNGVYYDGTFLTTTQADSFCPVVSETYYAGSNSSSTTVEAYVNILTFGSSTHTHLRSGSYTTTLTGTYDASLSASGQTFNITPGAQITNGDELTLSHISSNPGGTSSVTVGGEFYRYLLCRANCTFW